MNTIMKIKHTPLLLLALLLTACHSAWITNLAVASGQWQAAGCPMEERAAEEEAGGEEQRWEPSQ